MTRRIARRREGSLAALEAARPIFRTADTADDRQATTKQNLTTDMLGAAWLPVRHPVAEAYEADNTAAD